MAKPTNVDRSLFQAPDELPDLFEEQAETPQQEVSIEIEADDEGGTEVIIGDEPTTAEEPADFFDNLVDSLSDETLDEISSMITESVEEDKASREEYLDTYTSGLDLLGLKYETRTEPFDGATGVIHPILNEAVTQFQAGAYKEMLPSAGPVRANIVGETSREVEQQAKRVQNYMNYQIMYEMEEYEPEFDQMLYYLGLAGSAFKKVYRDDILNRPVSKFVPAEEIIVPYTAVDLRTA